MAKIIFNPYQNVNWNTVNQYKANFHCHTTESDGSYTPSEVIDKYHAAGYDILAITDHDVQGNPLPTWTWMDWGRDPEALGMLAVQGNEISRTHHITSLFSNYTGGNKVLYEEESVVFEAIAAKNGMAWFNHPVWHYDRDGGPPDGDNFYIDLVNDFYKAPCLGIEVRNFLTRKDDRQLWDRINAVLPSDRLAFGFGNDDAHNDSHYFGAYNIMLMSDLTESELRGSLSAGAFFFCYEPSQSGDGDVPHIEEIKIINDSIIQIEASNFDEVKWYGNNTMQVGSGLSIDVSTLGDSFVRAELIKGDNVTYTQPFGLNNLKPQKALVKENGEFIYHEVFAMDAMDGDLGLKAVRKK